ncbi:MAG: NAD(P)/FAD-dependent oxidoreductase, partial [Candidatus Nanopelagicales bacterium]
MADVVVVGAGLAGVRTCAELRAAGFAGSLLVLGAESDPPYDRPPLSKDPHEQVDLRPAMGLDIWSLADEVRLGVRVDGVDRAGDSAPGDAWRLTCSDGSGVRAGTLVVATGADPVLARDWDLPGVHVLHTRSDAAEFWPRVGLGVQLVVIGGGWVGCEAAATAATRGAQVQLFESGPALLAGRVPAEVADRVAGWLAGLGVTVSLGRSVQRISVDGSALQVADRRAEVVLAALGVRPATGWLADARVATAGDGAVLVDGWGRSEAPG